MPAQQRDQAHKINPALQFRSGMRKIDCGRDARLGDEQVFRRARRRREERHLSIWSGRRDARMNGKCQMTSPIPGLT
jgi:hypothetical protein